MKVSGASRGECVTAAHLNCTKINLTVFSCDVVRLGGVVHVLGGRALFGVSERGGVMSVQFSLGEKAVEQSGGVGSDTPVPSS